LQAASYAPGLDPIITDVEGREDEAVRFSNSNISNNSSESVMFNSISIIIIINLDCNLKQSQ